MHLQSYADPSVHISSFNDETNMEAVNKLHEARKNAGLYYSTVVQPGNSRPEGQAFSSFVEIDKKKNSYKVEKSPEFGHSNANFENDENDELDLLLCEEQLTEISKVRPSDSPKNFAMPSKKVVGSFGLNEVCSDHENLTSSGSNGKERPIHI